MNSSFEELLARDGRLIYTHVGDSMWPLLRDDRDLLVIEPVQGRLRRFDIALYRRDNGQAVLHRVLRVRKTDYLLCGDNRRKVESGITDEHIIGRLTAVIRGDKTMRLKGPGYRLYVLLWCRLFPLRALALRVRDKWKRMKR